MELFCISRLLNVVLENDEEFVYMDCSCPVGKSLTRCPQTVQSCIESQLQVEESVLLH